VLKKLVKATTAFALLVGCYLVYVRAFAVVVDHFRANRRSEGMMFPTHDSNSKLEAIVHARTAFGPKHWSATNDLAYRYYNAERGFWMYAKQVWRIVEENGVKYDGKRVRMAPFALISISRDGKNTKTVVSDEAIFDLNEPLSLTVNPDGEPLKIKHAWIERNVLIRDDRGTPNDPSDDMKVGPLTAVEYDEPTQKIDSGSDAVIQDREIKITGTEMEIKLRSMDPVPGQSPGGFQGAEYAILKRNVHVEIRDVGKSGILPGSSPTPRVANKEVEVRVPARGGVDQKARDRAPSNQPTPLDIKCDGMMRVDMPAAIARVAVGPPEPPAPTLVRFERNVVVLRGPIDDRPSQLTCDTLKLNLVPAEKPLEPVAAKAARDSDQSRIVSARENAQTPAGQGAELKINGQAGARATAFDKSSDEGTSEAGAGQEDGVFGNLTLQRAHATGHVVWLYLPQQGMKLKMNELIHLRQVPSKTSQTYCRGDVTRPFELDKVDMIQDENDPNYGDVTSVTHIRTIDATLFDDGSGFDTANVLARGPGRLETRPDRDQPVEHIAIWQKELIIRNLVGPDGKVEQKIVDLLGNRPCFIDKAKEASLDSAQIVRVWLKPKPVPESKPASTMDSLTTAANHADTRNGVSDNRDNATKQDSPGFQIDRLVALKDVHMYAPSKTMTAHERLDAEFVEEEQSPKVLKTSSQADDRTDSQQRKTADSGPDGPIGAQSHDAGQDQDARNNSNQPAKSGPEPPMTGSADRMWLRIAMKPQITTKEQSPRAARGNEREPAAATDLSTPGALGSNSEVRKVWMFGSVSLHQDPAQGKVKGNDASGDALYLDNRGEGKALTYVYQRDPTEDPPRPGPLPLAWVSTEDRLIKGELIRVNQESDQAWVDGPGTSTQVTDRGLLSDKAPQADVDDDAAAEHDSDQLASSPASRNTPSRTKPDPRDGRLLAGNDTREHSTARLNLSPPKASKPKSRGGHPLTENVPLTITWTKKMEFMGRSTDLEGQPAAKAIFYGTVLAEIEDGLLKCEDHMVTYADKVVPLKQLGGLSPQKSRGGMEPAEEDAEPEPKPDLAVIECFGKAVAITRKVHPDRPLEMQRQIVQGEYLNYDRRSGEFFVPGEGLVYLYDRPKKSKDEGSESTGNDASGGANPNAPRRTVTPTSGRTPTSASRTERTSTKAASTASRAGSQLEADIPPLVLTKIKFVTGMRGRFGTGKQNDKTDERWAEFFGDVDAARAEVPTVHAELNFDKLPSDGFSLTGQTLRVITEPPPAGSPAATPARNYLKAWDRAYARDATSTIQADVITYDSYKDLIYAYGEQGRQVLVAQQYAPLQPVNRASARAWQFNPKTHASYAVDSSTVMMVDKKTGTRPAAAQALDPNAKPPKKRKQQFRPPPSNIERRGFTGQ
jgi:hypothetical protein